MLAPNELSENLKVHVCCHARERRFVSHYTVGMRNVCSFQSSTICLMRPYDRLVLVVKGDGVFSLIKFLSLSRFDVCKHCMMRRSLRSVQVAQLALWEFAGSQGEDIIIQQDQH
jgi:hypothetical protein